MELIIIAAVAENRVIGKDGKIPWHISEDIQRFKQLTRYHPVIMGRKTWESIPAKYRPLPERLNIVLTRQDTYQARGAIVISSLEQAIEDIELVENDNPLAGSIPLVEGIDYRQAFIMGGQQIYEQALPIAQRLEITELRSSYKGDAYFPNFSREEWKELSQIPRGQYSFVSYGKE
ncbi:MAG: dihydrofolate reductase [Nanoarchaeota archaeon]